MSKKIGEQSLLKYEKLYNWGRTLITSGVIQNEDKFPSENILQKKFGYSRQTVRTALNQLEAEGLIKRVKGSGTYVSYEGNLRNGERPRIGLILSYFSDYLFPRVYDGIDSVMKEAGYDIDVAVTKNRLNDEAIYLEGLLNGNVAGFIIEGTRSFFPNPNIRLYEEIRKRNIPTLFIHNHYSNQRFDSVEMSDARAAYKLTEILIQNGHRAWMVYAPIIEPASRNFPPPRLLPPSATARIASSSKFSPMLLESAELIREEATMPAIPAHNPQTT